MTTTRHQARPPGLARVVRTVVGLVYLFGVPTHGYFALINPGGYRDMSGWAPPTTEPSRAFWDWFLPNARILGLGIAVAELAIAALILSRGRAVRVGLWGAAAFHVALAALFGMWAYTIPMIVLVGYTATFRFDRSVLATPARMVREAASFAAFYQRMSE